MKRLTMQFLMVLMILLGGPLHALWPSPDVKVEYPLASSSSEDPEEALLQEFLFYSIHSQVTEGEKTAYVFTPDRGGKFIFDGNLDELSSFYTRFTQKLQEGLSLEEFTQTKKAFLDVLENAGALYEQRLAEEIAWEHLSLGTEALTQLMQMLCRETLPEVRIMRAPVPVNEGNAPNPQLYYNLRLNAEDQKNIEKLIKKLADLNVFELLLKKKEMEKLGDKIAPVHPLRFMGYINSRQDLKKRLPKIKGNHFKWKSFVGGFGERMAHEASKNNLLLYTPGFAHATGVPLTKIDSFIQQHDWEGLVISIM